MTRASVRVVGTNALRIARRKQAFLERAREALGFPIEIVSGMEEARLIYSGVAHNLPNEPGRRLVVDIGGGSTEIIIGERFEPLQLESLQIGCVSLSQRYFGDGRLSAKRIERARLAARLELEPIQAAFQRLGWERAVGSSGTVRAIADSIRELDAGRERHHAGRPASCCCSGSPTPASLRALDLDAVYRGAPAGVSGRRGDPRGDRARARHPADALRRGRAARWPAVRHGRPHDALGRARAHGGLDAAPLPCRSGPGRARRGHGDAVPVAGHAMPGSSRTRWPSSRFDWAARLHEIGLDVAHNGYHRHGAYLLENADMPGFAREEQQLLARLVGSHRRKLTLDRLEDLIPPWDRLAIHLIVLLRIAVLLHRGRSAVALPNIELTARGRTLELRFPSRWLSEHPLTVADLQLEIEFLQPHGIAAARVLGRARQRACLSIPRGRDR